MTLKTMGNKFFEIFGRLMLIFLFVGVIAGVAYYYGFMTKKPDNKTTQIIVATGNSLTPTAVPTKTVIETMQLSGGINAFTKYIAVAPRDWQTTKDPSNNEAIDKLTLTKNGYSIVIYQAGMGGSMYSFADAKAEGPFAQDYTGTYTDFTGATGEKYRRIDSTSQNKPGEKSFTIVEKKTDSYQTPTTFGAISYTTPLSPDAAMLKEMDAIISSLKK